MGGPDGKIFGPRSWRTDRAQRGPCAMTEGQIFSRPARPNSVNKHFIIWPPRFSFFPFFSIFFFFRVTKFGMLLILTEKSGFIQQQSCFSSLLARAIDKIPVWGPYAILAGPDGFFRTCSRHHVRPSYGDFLNSFAMKARAGPYGSYNKNSYVLIQGIQTAARHEESVERFKITVMCCRMIRKEEATSPWPEVLICKIIHVSIAMIF